MSEGLRPAEDGIVRSDASARVTIPSLTAAFANASAAAETSDDRVVQIGTALMEEWRAWAREHDRLTLDLLRMRNEYSQREATLRQEQRTKFDRVKANLDTAKTAFRKDREDLEAAIEGADAALRDASYSPPIRVARVFTKEMRKISPVRAQAPLRQTWTPGELTRTLGPQLKSTSSGTQQLVRELEEAGSRTFGKRRHLRRGAILRYESVRADIAKLKAQLEVIGPFSQQVLASKSAAIAETEARHHDEGEQFVAERDGRIEEMEARIRDFAALSLRKLSDSWERTRASAATTFPSGRGFLNPAWSEWEPSQRVREVLLCWQAIPIGITAKVARTMTEQAGPDTYWTVPIVGDYRTRPGFQWNPSNAEATAAAQDACRSIILRLMAAIPAGKARFTFIDPLGSGNNVASFLELADWDPLLIDTRAWCQQNEITEKLAELNAHVEIVIQRYLKGRFESIEDYNVAAGEVAEPYRIVVIFDFPAQFNEQSAHLLARLVQNGARCGVYVLVVRSPNVAPMYGVDPDAMLATLDEMPLADHQLDDLALPRLPESTDAPPVDTAGRAFIERDEAADLRFDRDAEQLNPFTRVMLGIGQHGRGSNEITVTAERVNQLVAKAMEDGARSDLPRTRTPIQLTEPDTWWTADSSVDLAVPIGRSGARDAAMFAVNTAILSGGLVVGRPGSGKSTLLHALITGAATWYSPSEVELYLLDFKQGVEFLGYAEIGLPHARCVAIESEREFGLAILESVVSEMNRRAQVFKDTGPGIANVGDWRRRTGETMPRILVIIDEFQVLLNEVDSVSRRCAQALDMLIRQGRAFGIHLLLGSQSFSSIDPGGTVINTLKLLPIRIVLPSDSSDAMAVLGERNDGARYLTRQGEGLYNPAGGNPDLNVPFQGTWLNDDQRHAIVGATRRRADDEGFRRRPLVFNGQEPADLDEPVDRFVGSLDPTSGRLRLRLGEPFTLEPELSIVLKRDGGANVLVAVRDDELFHGLACSMVSSALVQAGSQAGIVRLVNFLPPDAPTDEWLQPLLGTGVLNTSRGRDLPDVLAGVRTTCERRVEDELSNEPLQVLVLLGIQRARDLDRGDDYWDASRPPDATAHLEYIVRNGPEVGVHVLALGDAPGPIWRKLVNSCRREFAWHIGGRMSPADAETFEVDAKSLKVNQLVCADVDNTMQNRLRGYRVPRKDWLDALAASV